MRAAWYSEQGAAKAVLNVGEIPDPIPASGEVLVRVHASGINPGEVKKRSDAFGVGMPFPRIIPHSDGSGTIEAVGEGVSSRYVGDRVWCFGAQSYRAFGTAAELVALPLANVAALPSAIPYVQGACLGIPGITGHRAIHVAGPVAGRTVLVQGGAGAVGLAAVGVARAEGARVLATVRRPEQEQAARASGAHEVLLTKNLRADEFADAVRSFAPDGVDHVVEVAFDANAEVDEQVLGQGGSIAAYATREPKPCIPFWPLVFKNVQIHFLGSDDFSPDQKRAAAAQLTAMLAEGWPGYTIAQTFPLERIAEAHLALEQGRIDGRIVLDLTAG